MKRWGSKTKAKIKNVFFDTKQQKGCAR